MTTLLDQTIHRIAPADAEALAAAEERQGQLTKPPGSLGLLERLGTQLSGIAAQCPPPVPHSAVVGVFAADHGVCAQGVTPWPQEVTVQMLANMAHGGAAINVLCTQAGITPMLTDVGVASDYAPHPNIRDRKVRRGTADLSTESAMTREQAIAAIEVGIEAANVLRRKVAVRLRSGLRASDVVASVGADSFVVLLAWIDDAANADRVVAKLAQSLQRPFSVAGQDVAVAVCVGVAQYPQHGKEAEALLRRALAQAGESRALGRAGLSQHGGGAAAANDD